MDTEYVQIKRDEIEYSAIEKAGNIIKQGGLVAFPTETVYGLGGDGLNPSSSKKIYAAKGRPSDNPLIVHIADMKDLNKIVRYIPESAKALADEFWPGPLTMIFKKSDIVPLETTGGLDTVAVRFPSDKIALSFIKAAGGYVAAPSANTSGRPSPTSGKYVLEDMDGKIDMILDGGSCDIGLESTIVDLTEDIPVILRPGYISEEMLSEVLGQVEMDQTILDISSNMAPKAPGMKYRHYAPKGDLTIIKGESGAVVSYVNDKIKEHRGNQLKIGIIATDETSALYQADVIKSVGKRNDAPSIARRLYDILREFDDEEVDVIYAESFDQTDMGIAIMNRLLKAAGHKVLEV